ncbi:receptor like protein 29-like [Gastrolobium bilobum]|uniref:receptor like protein 29-like n=1 Tax=Gastrolobium bilobum TaxID=150636 RepID=UPI002AB001F6|nr:receptor like protein 29-like [Gastrolobium bilobum]
MASLSLLLVWFLLFAGEEMVMEEEELLGLFEVMDALVDDPEWAQAHPQPCTDTPWPGVECEVSSDPPIFHVTKIHIGPDILSPPCKSSAYLSESLLKLSYLKTLSIFNCFVASPVTLTTTLFGPFSSLEHLALQSNPSLSGEIPPSLGGVTSLRVLSLSQNSLHGNIPRQIGGLVCLEQLELSYNNFSGQIPMEIGGLRSMTILDLSWNEIEGNLPYSLGQLQLLQKMDLSSNRLSGEIPPDLGMLKRLVLLDLSHNYIGGPIPENLSSLELLEYLVIDDNPIKAGIPSFIGNLWKLKSVSFSGCGLIGSIPNSFSSLKNLTALSLDNNSLSGLVPPNLGLLPNLDQLNISHNKLNGVLQLPDDFIEKLGKRLDVRGNSDLCIIDDQQNKKNLSSYLEIPSCVSIRPRNGNSSAEGPPEDPAGIKPSWYESNTSSTSSWLDPQVIQFNLRLFDLFGVFPHPIHLFSAKWDDFTARMHLVPPRGPARFVLGRRKTTIMCNQQSLKVAESMGVSVSNNSPPSSSSTIRHQSSRIMRRKRSGTSSTKYPDMAKEFTLAKLVAATNNFSLENKIGDGTYGVV